MEYKKAVDIEVLKHKLAAGSKGSNKDGIDIQGLKDMDSILSSQYKDIDNHLKNLPIDTTEEEINSLNNKLNEIMVQRARIMYLISGDSTDIDLPEVPVVQKDYNYDYPNVVKPLTNFLREYFREIGVPEEYVDLNVKKFEYDYLMDKAKTEDRDNDYAIYLQGLIGYKP